MMCSVFFQLFRYLIYSNLVFFSNKTCLLTCLNCYTEYDLKEIDQELTLERGYK